MFTLGIFTTHIPYIALVVFYAFFWVIGINKASSGEIQNAENSLSLEIPTFEIVHQAPQTDSFSAQNNSDQLFFPDNSIAAYFAQIKLKHKEFYIEKQREYTAYAVLFSRPPPFLS